MELHNIYSHKMAINMISLIVHDILVLLSLRLCGSYPIVTCYYYYFLVDIMKFSLMDIARIDCHLMRVNVVRFHLAVAPSQLVTSLQ